MSTYTPEKIQLPNGLDELGYELGMVRFPHESLDHFRQRILEEVRAPAGASQEEFIRSINRQVGLLDKPIFEIDLVLDSNGIPLAPDPLIEITSTYFRAYYDHSNNLLDIELSFLDRNNGYFLRDIETALAASTYFSYTVLQTESDYLFYKSSHLRYTSSNSVILSERLLESRSNNLSKKYIKSLSGTNLFLFRNEVTDISLLQSPGDYYIDYVNGVLFTYDTASGLVTYTYRVFPFRVFWQPVRVFPANDEDLKYQHYNTLISDETGLPIYSVLNSTGARRVNQTLKIHPLGWGE